MRTLDDPSADGKSPSRAVRTLRVLKLLLTVLVLALTLWRGVGELPL
ncbi:hypothetical protein [Halobacterium zhouii]|nr:hypothetical protein [Halobacterium zhouii]